MLQYQYIKEGAVVIVERFKEVDWEVVVDYCDECGDPIYKGEEVCKTNDEDILHEECVRDFCHAWAYEQLDVKKGYA